MHSWEHTHARAASGPETAAPPHERAMVQPLALPLAAAVTVSGLSRSALYRAAGRGDVILLKCGRSTLVDMASMRTYLAGLPRASIKAPHGHAER
jgi:hypothetical protein